ncbi:urea ABC transporter permease subunit UrtB [Tranquillimonas rosea]|uniref:urea ABC transporter permease subunit UrtB n=1 Tax=Tranquillimonas rosea TaxID=641238 RepID=UPI003BA8CAF2
MLRALCLTLALCLLAAPPAADAQGELQSLLQTHSEEILDPSFRTVGTAVDDLVASGLPAVAPFLTRWQDKEVWQRTSDGLFFFAEETGDDQLTLYDIASGDEVGTAPDDDFEQSKPNGGVRRVIGQALVQFRLSSPDISDRRQAVRSIERNPDADQLPVLRDTIEGESDPSLKARKERLATLLTARFGESTEDRIAAIETLSDDLSIDARAVLNQILDTDAEVAQTLPDDVNVARVLQPGTDMPLAEAYETLVDEDLAPARTSPSEIRAALEANIEDGRVAGIPTGQLGDPARRHDAYAALAEAGTVPPLVTEADMEEAVAAHVFYAEYDEDDPAITDAAEAAMSGVTTRVGVNQAFDLGLDALSLASIYFLAAIGLAITFGVMGVINMAHGEFIMMGAYTGFVVQQIVPDYTVSLLVALPLAFAVTFGAGVLMERLVIRWLYHRPLETLLATFGISIALQQLAKNIFGTQARPLTSPGWLDGAWVLNDVVSISYIRIAIFVLALIFLALLLFVLKRTRLGLEVRAVTQNPGMAASMGINPDKINMLTFGLGSGIAGIAGVAIGLYAKVTSEMGQDYIVQSFMTVVVGGVGNVWGTLAGATLIGGLQKQIEWFNPSNTLAAQTYMILFIILFIQFRPKGIVALKGRAAGD